jgi:hypothetical protein
MPCTIIRLGKSRVPRVSHSMPEWSATLTQPGYFRIIIGNPELMLLTTLRSRRAV